VNIGLPTYIALERKPDNGCEMWSMCCSETGIMYKLMIVKDGAAMEADFESDVPENYGHGTKVLANLVKGLEMSGRLIVADSFFASVEATEEMMRKGLHFLGTVKRSSRLYPKSHLENVDMEGSNSAGRYGRKMMEATTTISGRERKMYASVWSDKSRHFFIGTFTSPGIRKVTRERWRNVCGDEDNGAITTARTDVEVTMAGSAHTYFKHNGKIDQINGERSKNVDFESTFKVKKWHTRIENGLFGVLCVDTYNLWKACTGGVYKDHRLNVKQFLRRLSFELVGDIDDSPAGIQPGPEKNYMGLVKGSVPRKCRGTCKKRTVWICGSCDNHVCIECYDAHFNTCTSAHQVAMSRIKRSLSSSGSAASTPSIKRHCSRTPVTSHCSQ